MSQKNETIILIFSLLITSAMIGSGLFLSSQPSWQGKEKNYNVADDSAPSPPAEKPPSPPQPEVTPISNPKTFAEVEKVPSGLINYGGSTTWAPIRKEADSAIQIVWPDFRLRYTNPINGTPGSSSGIEMLLANELAFAQSSRPLKDEEYQKAAQKNFTLKEIPVAIDGIAIAIHPDLNIPGLTVTQLKDIYTGKITNWSQIGGPNIPIIPYSRHPEDGGTVEFFLKNVLGGEELAHNVKFVYSTTPGLKKVSENLGSIYYASAPEVVPQCTVKTLPIGHTLTDLVSPYQEPFVPRSQCPNKRNQLNKTAIISGEYPITRRLFVIVKENGQDDEKAGLAYANLLLTEQGQALIEKAGFVKIR